jgi:prolipoprotein diacylglyceryl transferase
MFPKISDLFNYMLGSHLNLPFQTYGFMLALAFLAGGMVLRSELKRKEREGRLPARVRPADPSRPSSIFRSLLQGIVVSVMAWKIAGIIQHFPRFASNPKMFLFSAEGSLTALVATALFCLGLIFYRMKVTGRQEEAPREETLHPYQHTWSIVIVALVAALAGSKLFDILDHFGGFLRDPIQSLLSFNGFAFYGGLLVTVFTLILYMRVLQLDWKEVIDCTAPAILVGYAVGRMGCHLSGDGCWGIANTAPLPEALSWLPGWLWSCSYPHNVINAGIAIPGCIGPHCMVLSQPVFPTSLYESLMSALSFGILWLLRKRIQAPVVLFGVFLVLSGAERLLIEQIRINTRFGFAGLRFTQAEAISVFLILAGAVVMYVFLKRWQRISNQGFASSDHPMKNIQSE